MESDLPTPIDDSRPFISKSHDEEMEEDEIPRQQYYYTPQPPTVEYFQPQKKAGDIFAELDRIHWIIFLASVLLAFFMGKSISTPIIIKSV
jgi:hypothetical protein